MDESHRMKQTGFDPILFWLALAASLVGLLAIFDSGYARAAADGAFVPREFKSQLVSFIAAVIGGFACWKMSPKQWKVWSIPAYVVTVLLLIVVKFAGIEINGAKRWIDLKLLTLQPAEFAKLAVILVLALILSKRKPTPKPPREPNHWAERLDWIWIPRILRSWPLLLSLVASGLILIEPDLATAMVIMCVSFVMLFLGGISRGSMISLVFLMGIVVTILVIKEPYRMERIANHTERWESANIDGIGYQTTQSEAAMANGGVFGVGLGEGRAKHTLPAPTTDFIMSTIAEEFGLVGTLAIMGLMGGICWRLNFLAKASSDKFGKLILYGVGSWIGIQSCTNIVMANGSAPPIGVPMPFISAGGSSLMALWMAMGLCLAVTRTRVQEELEVETHRIRGRDRRSRLSSARNVSRS